LNIPFLDLAASQAELLAALEDAMRYTLRSGKYILGEEVAAFEAEFAEYCGARDCVGVASGLDALELILRAMSIGPGDEVIVPSNTYIASWLAVSYVGAKPVPVEPVPGTYNLNPEWVEAAITPRTRAIMVVHLYGQPADMDPIIALARPRRIGVIEDAAQAHGSRYKGRRAGSLGDAAGFSFYPTKNLGAVGDGGAVVSDNATLIERVRLLRNYGSAVKHHNEMRGFNSRLDELQAALLRVKLRKLDEWNGRRQALAAIYRELLAGSDISLPEVPDWAEPNWHLFVIRSRNRDELGRHLATAGIETMIHYPVSPHLQPAYAELGLVQGSLPVAEVIHREVLSLPMWPQMQLADAQRVADAVTRFRT
jgi:dTDP-4-amino-4,6-dideoxygalactose transaminase